MGKIFLTDEQRIVNTLIMRSNNSKFIGLFDGKIGVAIAFFHYYRSTRVQVYQRYAYKLLYSALNSIVRNSDISFATGLLGIGWGVEYIIQNGFAEGDSYEICEEIDEQIMYYDPRRISEIGIYDLLEYILIHCKNGIKFDSQYIDDIEMIVSKQKAEQFSVREQSLLYKADILKFASAVDISGGVSHNIPIGINGGLAGELMKKYVAI